MADDRFEFWAQVILAIAAGLALLVAMSVFVETGERSATGAATAVQTVATAVLLFLGVVALNRGAPWARAFALVLLVLIVVEGALRFGVAIANGRIGVPDVPLVAIGALAVLGLYRGRLARDEMQGSDRRTLLLLSAAAIAVWLWGTIVGPLSTGPTF